MLFFSDALGWASAGFCNRAAPAEGNAGAACGDGCTKASLAEGCTSPALAEATLAVGCAAAGLAEVVAGSGLAIDFTASVPAVAVTNTAFAEGFAVPDRGCTGFALAEGRAGAALTEGGFRPVLVGVCAGAALGSAFAGAACALAAGTAAGAAAATEVDAAGVCCADASLGSWPGTAKAASDRAGGLSLLSA